MSDEKTEKVSVTIRMPADLHETLKILAMVEDRSLSKQLIQIIKEWLQDNKNEEIGDGIDKMVDDFMRGNKNPYTIKTAKAGVWASRDIGTWNDHNEIVVRGKVTGYHGDIDPNSNQIREHTVTFMTHGNHNFNPRNLIQSVITFSKKRTGDPGFSPSPSYSFSPSASESASVSPSASESPSAPDE